MFTFGLRLSLLAGVGLIFLVVYSMKLTQSDSANSPLWLLDSLRIDSLAVIYYLLPLGTILPVLYSWKCIVTKILPYANPISPPRHGCPVPAVTSLCMIPFYSLILLHRRCSLPVSHSLPRIRALDRLPAGLHLHFHYLHHYQRHGYLVARSWPLIYMFLVADTLVLLSAKV
jgi:hypothetical protein